MFKLLWVDIGFEGYILAVIDARSIVKWIGSLPPFEHTTKFYKVTYYPVGWNK